MKHTTSKIFPAVVFLFLMVTGVPEVHAQHDDLLIDADGEKLSQVIESYRGEKAVLINIWATWCAPCVEEFPDIVRLQRAYPEQLKVVFVSADFPESRDRAIQFLEKQNVDWTTYFKTGKDQPFIESLSDEWSGALPFTKVIGKEGEVIASWEQVQNMKNLNITLKKH